MKRLDEDQYVAMTNLNMLTVITDALMQVLAQDDGVMDEAELQHMKQQCARWLSRYHEVIMGEDEQE